MNKFIRTVVVAAAAVAATAATAAIGVPSAQAAVNDGACDYTESCVFQNWNYGGGLDDIATTDGDWRNNYFTNGLNVNDQGSSGFGIERAQVYYQGISYTANYFILGFNQYDAQWTTNQPNSNAPAYNFNDQVSSNSIYVP